MPRVHLFELEDQTWFPQGIRNAMTDYLQEVVALTELYAPIIPLLERMLARSGTNRVVDLGSGAGGPWLWLYSRVAKEDLEVTLTDLYPAAETAKRVEAAFGGRVHFHPEPVDARQVPEALLGLRTMFASFHHFPPEQAQAILQDAVLKGRGIAIFEATERRLPAILPLLFSPLFVWLLTPRIKPRRLSRLLLTYLLPVVPLAVVFDGVVSSLRTYSPEELRALVAQVDAPAYRWEVGMLPIARSPIRITYLLGYPEGAAVAQS